MIPEQENNIFDSMEEMFEIHLSYVSKQRSHDAPMMYNISKDVFSAKHEIPLI